MIDFGIAKATGKWAVEKHGSSQFPTTRWTLVVAAADPHRKEARSALVSLCEIYWYPLYAWLCPARSSSRSGAGSHAGVLHQVLEGRYLDRADPVKGRFRPFSLGPTKRIAIEPAHDETPERIFERRWALAVLDRVVEILRNEFVHHGRPEHFPRLKVFLLGHSDAPYATLAREMNTSEGALKVAIHRLRKRDREVFRQEIADPGEVEPELAFCRPH